MSAPIALFAYRRPGHLRRCLESLAANAEAADSNLTVYVDGPRGAGDLAQVEATRAVAREARGFASVSCVFRKENLGLSRSIIQGVSEQLAMHGELVVVEDDLVVSPHFLRFMNEGLQCYRQVEEVVCIHGYVYPIRLPLPQTFLLRGADCWGWATWARGWSVFDSDGARLLRSLEERGLSKDFDFDGTAGYMDMLRAQVAGRNDSWAIRWYASAFLAGGLTLYPGRTLVENVGDDGSGTHDAGGRLGSEPPSLERISVTPLAPEENKEARRAFARHFSQSRPGPASRLLRGLRRLLKRRSA